MRKTLLILVIFLLFFVSCSKKAVKPIDNPGSLYVDGVEQLKKKKYDTAITNFAKIRENFPFDPIAVVAQVKQGDAYFAKKDYQLAANTYEDFVNSYPDDENTAYALKRLGESYEKQSPAIDRDQAITVKAVERFTFLKNRYPASPYAEDAETHIGQLNRKLGARELYVGEFYYKAGNYNASVLRLEYFLKTYPDGADKDKVLHYLAEDYRQLNRPDKERYYLDWLRREFPKSVYAKSAKKGRKPVPVVMAAPAVGLPAVPATRMVRAEPVALTPAPADVVQSSKADLSPAAADPTYEEKKKRQIDLKPPEEPAPPAPPKAETQGPGTASKDKPDPSSGESEATSSGNGGDVAEAALAGATEGGPESKAPSREGIEPKPKAALAGAKDSAGKDAGGNEGSGPKEKKNRLGFFTEKKPVDVVADTMEAFEKGKTIVFKGNVVAKQEGSEPGQTLYLFSDTLTAYRTDESSDIQKAEAEGNVKVVKAQRTATCKQAFFYNDKGEVILKGDVVVFEGNDRLTGDTATYYLNEDRVYVQGDKEKRARVIVTPKK